MTIYLDIVLIENIVMNYVILFATGVISKVKVKILNIGIASVIGGFYAIVSFIITMEFYRSLVIKILLSIVMIYIAFRADKAKMLYKQLMLFYLVSFAFGGTAFALLYFIRPQDILIKDGILLGTYPIKMAILGAILGFVIVYLGTKEIKNRISKKDMFCDLEIKIEEKELNIRAMIDTGNLLREPITGLPVIIVESEKLKEILPEYIIQNLDNIIEGKIKDIDDYYMTKLRIIPFTSIGKQNGILLGIKSDEVKIKIEEDIYKINDVIIGMYNRILAKNLKYNALIGLDILEGGKNGFTTNIKKYMC